MTNAKNGKNVTKALMLGTALVSLSSHELNAATFTDVGLMSAIILTPISVTNQATLHFGTMTVAGGTAGTMLQPPTGGGAARAPGGGVSEITGAALETNGILRITASPAAPLNVTVTAATFPVTHTTIATQTMSVNAFNLVTNAGGLSTTVTIPATQTLIDVPVGATLNVAAGQQDGTYTGEYTVMVNY